MNKICCLHLPLALGCILSLAASMVVAGDAPALSSLKPAATPFSVSKATMPETAAFYYMRGLAGSSTLTLDELRSNLQTYLAMAQDHKRRGLAETDWVIPDEFRRHRGLFKQFLDSAADALKAKSPIGNKVASPIGSGSGSSASAGLQKKAQADAEAKCVDKLIKAGKAWEDPAIRSFLTGLAYMQSKDTQDKKDKLGLAENSFRQCVALAPQVAAFHQAYGEALSELNRHLEAVVEFTMALRLAPGSKQALERLNAAMLKVQGVDITRPEYLQAREVADQRQGSLTSGGSSGSGLGMGRANAWLMPVKSGAGWPAAAKGSLTLPTPPYDRLLFLQAVAVPVGKNTLLVDGSALKDALEVTVQIDDRTLATAKVGRIGSDKTPPLAILTVTGFEFTPLTGDKTTKFKAPMGAHLFAANAYEEMGQTVRDVKIRVKTLNADGSPKVDEKVLPGEAAAPVASDDGVLAGFVAGKTDVSAEGGGPNKFYPLKDILPLIGNSGRVLGGSSAAGGGGGAAKTAPGKFFLVHIVQGELF